MRVFILLVSVALIIAGVACIANPPATMAFLALIVGFVMLFSGFGAVAYYLRSRALAFLVDGVVSLLIGGALLFSSDIVREQFIPTLIALWLLFKGAVWLLYALRLGRFSPRAGGSLKLMGLLYIILGVVFLLFPNAFATLFSFALGFVLIIGGIMGLSGWYAFRLR